MRSTRLRYPCASLVATIVTAMTVGCGEKPPVQDPNAHVPEQASVTWKNWSRDVEHKAPKTGDNYFSPTNLAELQAFVRDKQGKGVTLRVSGQRHSQPPLVATDTRDQPAPETPKHYFVDLACYRDLGDGTQNMVLSDDKSTVTVNAGVRVDKLDEFLTNHQVMLRTVTAGGFFSVGGMTAVDVNGATLGEGIFADTVSAFTIMGPDGELTTIDASTPGGALDLARVSLGGLGIVTSLTLELRPRPYTETLQLTTKVLKPMEGSADDVEAGKKFAAELAQQLKEHYAAEVFYNVYSQEFLAIYWDRVDDPSTKTPAAAPKPVLADACTYAEKGRWGALEEGPVIEPAAEAVGYWAEDHCKDKRVCDTKISEDYVRAAIDDVKKQVDKAAKKHAAIWFADDAVRVVFMSYTLELDNLEPEGLIKLWDALLAVHQRVETDHDYLPAGPMEFRFFRGGKSAMGGNYSERGEEAVFVNIDLLAFARPTDVTKYPDNMRAFFAHVERIWWDMGGVPHNGKMYGFFDPGDPESVSAPFNPLFMEALKERRGERVTALETFRQSRDPEGMFCNEFLGQLTGCTPASAGGAGP